MPLGNDSFGEYTDVLLKAQDLWYIYIILWFIERLFISKLYVSESWW